MIGICELLHAIWKHNCIDEYEYYHHLLTLRRGNYRYIPIGEHEIIFHLKQAVVEDGVVTETDALRVIREYHASCLLDKEFLQIIDSPFFSETPFVIEGVNTVLDALLSIWKDEGSNTDVATARANWIFENLYTGNLGCAHLRNATAVMEGAFDDVAILALDICNLLMKGVLLATFPNAMGNSRERYFRWLAERILSNPYLSVTDVIGRVANGIKEQFFLLRDRDFSSDEERSIGGFLLGRFFLDLPETIRNEIDFDSSMTDWLKVKVGHMVTTSVGDFDAAIYWKAVGNVVNDRDAEMAISEAGVEYSFRKKGAEQRDTSSELFPTIEIVDIYGNIVESLQDPTFSMLWSNKLARLNSLNKLRSWFDCSNADVKSRIKNIAEMKNPVERVLELYEIRNSSTDGFYRTLEQRFRKGESVPWRDLMPPSVQNLAGYYRLPLSDESDSFSKVWSDSATLLFESEDLASVISRLSNLPLQMPEPAIEKFLESTDIQKLEIVRHISLPWASPIRLLHAANLACRSLPTASIELRELAQELLARLYKSENSPDEFAAFHATLTFVSEQLDVWVYKSRASSQTILALLWAHTSALFHIQRALGLDAKTIVKTLKNTRPVNVYETLERKERFAWNDCLNPRRINRDIFLVHAAGKIFQGLDQRTLDDLDIPNLIRGQVFPDSEKDYKLPKLTLLTDSSLCEDQLMSLFGGDRFEALAPIIGPQEIDSLKSGELKRAIRTYFEEIGKDKKVDLWSLIHLMASDLPLHEELREVCSDALKNFRVDDLLQDGVNNPEFIFFAAANQVSGLRDDSLAATFRKSLLEIINRVKYNSDELENRGLLIDSGLILSAHRDPIIANEEFVRLLEGISRSWNDFKLLYGFALADVVWSKPVQLSKPWWHFTLTMRTLPNQ